MISTYQSRKARAQRRKFRSRLMHMERLEDRMVLTGASPVAVNDAYLAVLDTPLVIASPGVLANDTDAESDPLTASIFSGPNHGSVTLSSDGSFTYTPAAGYTGLDSFLYRANDGTSSSKLAAVTIRVRSTGNQAPVASPDSYTVSEDGVLDVGGTHGLLANDTDPDGNPLTSVLVTGSGPSHGTLSLNPNGSFNYVPDPDFHGTDSFSYQASDGSLFSPPAEVTITVTSEGDAPVAANDEYSTDEDETLVVAAPGVLENDFDADEDPLSAVIVSPPQHGTLTLDDDGNFAYIPDADFNGVDGFSYIASDGTSDSDVAAVMITVNSINDDPVAENDEFTTAEDVLLTVLAPGVLGNDADADGDDLSIFDFTAPVNGTLTLNPDGSLTYLPNADYFGPDAFAYRTTDGTSVSNFAAVTIEVTEVNDAPVASADTATVAEDNADNVIDVLGNDTAGPANESGQILTVTSATALHGTVTINPDGTLNYTPDVDFFGSDTITYTITDDGTTNGSADPLTATSSVSVTVTEINDAPVANPDTATVAEDSADNVIDVLGNDTAGPNEGSQTLTVNSASALHGTVVINPDGTLSYTPDADYFGSDTITYTITDDGTTNGVADPLSATSSVSVTVTEINDAPIANPDSATVAEDSVDNIIDVLSNDSAGPNEGSQTLTVTSATALHGTVVINPDGTLSYTPGADYFGSDTITYTITDDGTTNGVADQLTATGTVSITATEINDAPVANPDTATVAEDSADNVIDVLANDSAGSNESGQTLTVTSASALHGTVVINPDGTLNYTPDADYFGSDTITYTITDDGTTNGAPDPLTATGSVSITATEINDPPVANPDTATVAEDSADNVIDVLANDSAGSNESGQTLTVTSASALHGTVVINPDGTLSYTPDVDYFGSDTITYTITDDGTTNGAADPLTAISSVSVTVTEINDAPVANPDSATVDEDSVDNVIDVLSNDTAGPNEDAQTLTVTSATALNGTVVINPDGTLSYTPDADYFGPDTITYTITDDGTTNGAADPLSAASTVSVTVTNVNDAPVGVNDDYVTDEDTPLSIPVPGVLGNDTDADGDTLTVVDHTTPANGTLTVEEDGSFVYTPNPNFHGTDGFAYLVDDGTTSGDWTAVTIEVAPINDAPTAVADTYNTAANVTLNVASPGVLGNDSDVDGDVLSAVPVSGPSHGTLTLNPNGSFSYLANAGFIGVDTFTYAASDGTTSTEATVTINVTGPNQKPVARNDSFTVDQDTVLDVPAPGVLGNDTDPNGDAITAVFFPSNPALPNRTAHGTITLSPDGSFIYTPDAGFEGDDFFLYQATDGHLKSSFAAVTIHVVAPTEALFARFGGGGSGSDLIGDGLLDLLAGDQTGTAGSSKKPR